MAERAKPTAGRPPLPRSGAFGTAAGSARQQFAWMWSRESVVRLVLSFVLATALWLYITGKQDPALSIEYPQPVSVAPENLSDNLVVASNLPAVHAWYRNSTTVPITPASFHPYVDLANYRTGFYRHVPVKILADPGIQDPKVTPATIPLAIETIQSKAVPVKVHVLNAPPEGFHVDSIQVQPSAVTVQGPRSLVSQVAQAGISIALAGDRFSVQGAYPPEAENSQGNPIVGRGLSILQSEVNYDVRIKALSSYKTLPVLVSVTGQPRAGFGVSQLYVQPVEITAKGSPSTLGRISSVSTYPVSISHKAGGTMTSRVKIRLPSGVQTDRNSQWATVKIQLAPVQAGSSIEIGVSPLNLGPGLVAHLRPAKVLVTVVGSSAAIKEAASRIHVTADVGGLGPGTYQLRPVVTAAPGLRVDSAGIYPSIVTVVLASSLQ